MEEWGQIGPGSLNLASPTEVGETIKGTSSLHGVVSRTEQGEAANSGSHCISFQSTEIIFPTSERTNFT